MVMATTDSFAPKKSFFEAQENQITVLNTIYDRYPIQKPFRSSALEIAENIGSTYSVVGRLLEVLVDLKVMSREIGWLQGEGSTHRGKYAEYVLLLDREKGIQKLRDWQNTQVRNLSTKIGRAHV